MNTDPTATGERSDPPASRLTQASNDLQRALQWAAFAGSVLVGILATAGWQKVAFPEAPILLVCFASALAATSVIINFPPVFWRVPSRLKPAASLILCTLIIVTGVEISKVQEAYARTPQGAREAAAAEQQAAKQAIIDAKKNARETAERNQQEKTKNLFAEAAATQKQFEDYAAKLEGCFSSFGHRLPALEEQVRTSLHNPDSFEHVETTAVISDAQQNNIAMSFRAENGFGAIRMGVVRAKLNPESCGVESVGTPE